jgi:hypothetical protein
MRHSRVRVLVGTAAILVAGFGAPAAAAHAKGSGGASIVVRTYTQPDSHDATEAARRTAGTILERAGIEVAWVECRLTAEVAEAADACTQPLRSNELVVRIVPAAGGDRRHHVNALGFAYVDLDAGGGALATVYADRVGLMAQSSGVDAAELLGRAMAHEIGHLLLGTNQHASRGLMRASWSGTDIRRRHATEWLFAGKEGDLMRRGIAHRLRGRVVPSTE